MVFAGRLHGAPVGRIAITLTGRRAARRRIELSTGSMVYTTRGSSYRGAVTSIRGHDLAATLVGPAGRIQVRAHLTLVGARAFTGRVTLS